MSSLLSPDFTLVRNVLERVVFDAVLDRSPSYPGLAHDPQLLADVACVALNRLPARYICYEIDYRFYQTEDDRMSQQKQVDEAVDYAFGFVQSREAMRARR